MSRVAIDLHMHSALSPCGSEDMTPNNIVNMALINELDYIALTDHNSARNLPATISVAKDLGLCILPGIEVTTKEEAHILTYFDNLDDALEMGEHLYKHLPNIPNNTEFFGNQYILDDEDEIVGEIDKLLISATDLSIMELYDATNAMGGVVVPAHVDRKSYSIIASLGFVPPDLPVHTLEVSKKTDFETVKKSFRFFKTYQFIHGSDAHYLEDIAEREYFVELEDMRKVTLLNYLA